MNIDLSSVKFFNMTRRLKVPYSLSRKRIRASLNKYNVYNALTWRKNRPLGTQYRQVFFAKQESRAYHGDRLTENQFKNHFRGDLPVVSPLQPSNKNADSRKEVDIPYALQTFVGLERRLDFAVFRSLFASSVRQAAFFILRGSVKVNGVRIKSPGYILKQGDVFSCDPRRVLYALGRPKPSLAQAIQSTNRIISKFNKYLEKCRKSPELMFKQRQKNRRRHVVFNSRRSDRALKRSEQHNKDVQRQMNAEVKGVKPKSVLEQILLGSFEAKKPEVLGAVREIRRLAGISYPAGAVGNEPDNKVGSNHHSAESTAESKNIVDSKNSAVSDTTTHTGAKVGGIRESASENSSVNPALAYFDSSQSPPHRSDIKKLLTSIVDSELDAITASWTEKFVKPGEEKYDPKWVDNLPKPLEPVPEDITMEQLDSVKVALPFSTTGGKLYGLAEPKKTWFTPWSPRQFLAPFAVLPHHLEIDFETCHAVYLRDPVARPGHSEVISPFNLDMHERAYLWYVYRRRKNLPNLHIN